MAIKSNVQETTTSTGVGDVTLAGVSEDGNTFASEHALNERFPYLIDDMAGNRESGIGYLSDATTLVRENPLEGSAALPVNFGAGTKQVFSAPLPVNLLNSSLGFSDVGQSIKFTVPFNLGRINSTQALVANRQYFFEAVFVRAMVVDLMGVYVSTGAGTSANKIHIALYDVDPLTGKAGNVIMQATDLDPSSAGLVSGSVTETLIQAGVYIMSIWTDTTPSIKANDTNIKAPSALSSGSTLNGNGHNYTSSLTALTELPSPAVETTNNANGKLMCIALGHT
jgi:hypothetical protein